MIIIYGDEDQNDLMNMIKNYKGEDEEMEEARVQKILDDIKAYREAIDNAEGALAEAERELIEELDRRAAQTCKDKLEDYPE